ncbi:peptidylprolyl isomerase [Bacteroidia bacterium]|nr:peptidylprolyl isomerase [Bacteroidia bacterium]GHT61895.1 peptidylprolyl isomerase [Bacteroidia bacterium]
MATLEKIRNRAGLLVGVVGVALLAFIIGDFLRSGSTFFNQRKEKIVIVDGEAIGYQEFLNKVEELNDAYKSNYGGALPEDQQEQIRQSVYDEMVGRILLDNESKKTGLTVGPEELTDMIMGKNISPMIQQYFRNPQTGTFDRNQLLQFLQVIESEDTWGNYSVQEQQQLAAERMRWDQMKTAMVEQKKIGKLAILLASAVVTNSVDAKATHEANSVNVDFNFVAQPFTSIPDSSVKVTDNEIKALYDKRKEEFKQDEARVIDYIATNISPSKEDSQEAFILLDSLRNELQKTDEVADIINDNSDIKYTNVYLSTTALSESERVFVGKAQVGEVEGPVSLGNNIYDIYKLVAKKEAPDSVKLNLIALPNFTDDARLTAYADSLIRVIAGGKSFTQMVTELTNGQGNGEVGWQTEASLVRNGLDMNFVETIFKSENNKVFIQRTSLRNYLVQVSEKTKPVAKYKLGTIQYAVTASPETMNKLYNDLSAYISKNNKLESFKNSAEAAGFICQKDVPVYAAQTGLPSVESSRQVIRWAFGNGRGKISEIMQCGDHYVVAAVEGELKAGYRPVKDVADILKRELINQKKGELLVKNLEAKNFTSLDDYASAMNAQPQEVKFVTFNTSRIAGIGTEPAVNTVALATVAGKLSKPFAGKAAAYVLSVTDKKTSEQPYNEKVEMQTLDMQNSYKIMSFMQDNALLKETAKIEDNRIRFF